MSLLYSQIKVNLPLPSCQITPSQSPLHCPPACMQRFSSLAAGGGIGKAWTGAELPKSCEVSHETTPPLAPNCLLHAGFLVFISL